MPTDKTLALVKQFSYGSINVDVLAGFEAGTRSARAQPPEHLVGKRWSDWMDGRKAATDYLATRRTYFVGQTRDGTTVEVVRKGWVSRGPVVSQMERQGVTGDVYVTYVDGSRESQARTVKCGI